VPALEFEKKGPGRRPSVEALVERAIRERKIAAFQYEGKFRVVEIHAFGAAAGQGDDIILGWQTGGFSRSGRLPGWRLFNVDRISEFELAVQGFTPSPGQADNDPRFRKVTLKV